MRCVKPPLLFGDVSRPQAMTVDWTVFAQSLTDKPMKGMLTGPITILQWSFVRDDQPRADTALQIALAIRDEVADLQAAGIAIIQIDEPAIREGLPLRRAAWGAYLAWATRAFRVAASAVRASTCCARLFTDRPLMRTSPRPPAPPPARPGAANFVRSAMKLTTIEVADSLSMRMSCPSPPRNRPAPPESGRRRL